MNGATILLKSLEKHNVKTVFGIPGGVLLKLYDELKNSDIEHILTRHEQGAIHAADGYARVTGEVGVCIATSGPGAANLITGLGNALSDSTPIIALTGQVKSALLGKDAFQEINTVGLSQAVTKHNYIIKDAKEIPRIVDEAFLIATSGRPGPVLIDICADVYFQEVDERLLETSQIPDYILKKFSKPFVKDKKIDKVIKALNKAKKPLLLVGNGVNLSPGAPQSLLQLVNKLNLMATNTLHAKGVLDEDHPNSLRMLGMHGTFEANYAIQNCDLLINIGSRFDDRITCNVDHFLEKCEYIVHCDIDASEFSKNVQTDVAVQADANDFLQALLQNLDRIDQKDYTAWNKEVVSKRKGVNDKPNQHVHPILISKEINNHIDEKTIIVTDVGQHQMFAALYMYPRSNRQFVSSGGLGTMGYGLPAAVGSAFAKRDNNVILVTGDGSFQMTFQELALLKEYNLNVKVVIYDNNCLGMVRQWQELFYDENYAESLFTGNPDWKLLTASYGLDFVSISKEEDIDVFKKALDKKGPVVIEVKIDAMANVFPMVPSSESLTNIRGE